MKYINLLTYEGRQNFYNSKYWGSLRALKLNKDPLCQHCSTLARPVGATQVDHIIDIQDDPDLFMNIDNLQSLCAKCHSKKTYDKYQFGREVKKMKPHNLKINLNRLIINDI